MAAHLFGAGSPGALAGMPGKGKATWTPCSAPPSSAQAGNYGDQEFLDQAQERLANYLKDSSTLHPDIRGLAFSLAAQGGDEKTYDQLWGLERQADLQEEKIRLLLALARFTQPELLQETLRRALTDDVRSQDTITVITAVGPLT